MYQAGIIAKHFTEITLLHRSNHVSIIFTNTESRF